MYVGISLIDREQNNSALPKITQGNSQFPNSTPTPRTKAVAKSSRTIVLSKHDAPVLKPRNRSLYSLSLSHDIMQETKQRGRCFELLIKPLHQHQHHHHHYHYYYSFNPPPQPPLHICDLEQQSVIRSREFAWSEHKRLSRCGNLVLFA